MKRLTFLFLVSLFISCQNAEIQNQLSIANNTIDSLKMEIAAAQKPQLEVMPGFIHTVFVWLKTDLSEKIIQDFEKNMETLREISNVQRCYIGPPAGTPRKVVDNSYDYAIIVHFQDKAAHDAYQIDSIHQFFLKTQGKHFEKIQIYDNLIE